MNIGVCLKYEDTKNIEDKIKTVRENGFDTVQLLCWNFEIMTKDNAELIKELLKKHGLKISALWCGWEGPKVWDFYDGYKTLGLLPEEYREMRIKNLCDGADFAKLLGVTDVVTHMGFIPENPHDEAFMPLCNAIREVAAHLEKNGQNLIFESGQETPVAMLRCFEEVNMSNLGVNLDTANLILYGKANPVDSLDTIGGYVKNIHAKDGLYPKNGHDLGEETRIGDGRVDFEAFFKKLKSLGYKSYVTIEREISGEKQLEDILYAKEYLSKIIKKVYGDEELC